MESHGLEFAPFFLRFLLAFSMLKKLLTPSQWYFSAVILETPGKVEGFSVEEVAGRIFLFLSFPHHLVSP